MASKSFAFAALVAASVYLLWPLIVCGGACTIDFDASFVKDRIAGHLAAPDTRLNTWILWWVQHSVANSPSELFEGNVFWPLGGALVGSEHMLSLALATWPLRLVTSDALVIYNAALLLTTLVSGIATYALIRWLSDDTVSAVVAGVVSMFMPWRVTELVHVQLLTAGLLPLIWLFALRTLSEKEPMRPALALAAVWLIQLFCSYYIAFFAIFSTVALIVTVAFFARTRLVRIAVVVGATGVPILALVAFSLPYLRSQRAAEVVLSDESIRSLAPSWVFGELIPSTLALGTPAGPWSRGYELPIAVLVLAGVGSVLFRRRSVVAGLGAAMALALVMSFGRALFVGDVAFSMPASWASALLPGFANLRGPLRWTIVIGVALPILAGLGLASIRKLQVLGNLRMVGVVTAVIVFCLGVDLAPPRLTTSPAYGAREAELRGLGILRYFEPGVVLDVPWPENPRANALVSSEYMVASTVHEKPILAGYTAYMPRDYAFLLRAARNLPSRRSLDQLFKITEIRWIVLHESLLGDAEREAWDQAATDNPLILAYRDDAITIYELPMRLDSRAARDALLISGPEERTVLGLRRDKLSVSPDDGIFSVSVAPLLPGFSGDWMKAPVHVRIVNDSERPWPGLDPDREGLVLVRYRILDSDGRTILDDLADLDGDVPAGGELATYVLIEGTVAPGAYQLQLSLVQQAADEIVELPLASVSTAVKVVGGY